MLALVIPREPDDSAPPDLVLNVLQGLSSGPVNFQRPSQHDWLQPLQEGASPDEPIQRMLLAPHQHEVDAAIEWGKDVLGDLTGLVEELSDEPLPAALEPALG